MNLKSTSLGILSLSLLMQSSMIFAASKNPQLEIKNLQSSLVKNKNSIDNLLIARAHVIPKELENIISGPGAGNYTNKTTLSQAIRTVLHNSVNSDQTPENIFSGIDAVSNLLTRNYRMSEGDKSIPSANPTEKIYSINVINPEQVAVLKLAQERINVATNNEDDKLISEFSKLINLSIKANRYLTYKEADALTNQIAKMNSDLQDLEELAIELPLKDQTVVNNFKKSMDEWLNKKIVFQKIGKEGFQINLTNDYSIGLAGIYGFNRSVPLNRDYSSQNIANRFRAAMFQEIARSDSGLMRLSMENPKKGMFDTRYKDYFIDYDEAQSLAVTVNSERNAGVISTKKFSLPVAFNFYPTHNFTMMLKDKIIYDRAVVIAKTNYYNQNLETRVVNEYLDEGSEISMKNINKNSSFDIFGNGSRKAEFTEIKR